MELAARRDLAERFAGAYGVMLWTLAGFALYLLVGLGAIFVTAIVFDPLLELAGFRVEAGELGLSVRNALEPLLWGLLVAAASMPIGRRLVGGIRFSRDGWLVLATGLVLATVTWLLIEEFVRARMEDFDLEYVGFTILTWPALVAIALCGWAALATPRGTNAPLVIPLVLATVGFAVALLPSIPGVGDGIQPESMPLVVVFLMDLLYGVLAIVVSFRHAAPRSPD